MNHITIVDPGKTTFKRGEVISQEAFDKENERVASLGEKTAKGMYFNAEGKSIEATYSSNGKPPTRPRVYTPSELAEITKVFYEAQARRRATIYAGLTPVYTRWEDLTQSQRDEAIRGLQERIEREGLEGYLERKRPVVGDELTEEIVHELERQGYL